MRRSTERWLAPLFAALVGGLAVALQGPPSPLPAGVSGDRFSAERAMRHVRVIAKEPHPVESKAAEVVRAYLVGELEALGLDVEVQERRDLRSRNVIGVLRGAGGEGRKALVLAAHYDSVHLGPGAGDDASGVAAILEALRALKSGPPLDRDVIALFTDGEEGYGLAFRGSRSFVEDLRWVRRAGLVLNFEARGDAGASFLFETSDRNGHLVREFARGAEHPLGTSLAYSVYKLMPNDTDLTLFKRAGLPGMNFAFVGRVDRYHSPLDTPENLDRASLQHQGSYALSLSRHFGNLDLDRFPSEPDAIYFPAFGTQLIVYPGSWAVPLMVAAVVAWISCVAFGLRKRRLSLGGLASGIVLGFAALVVSIAAAWGLGVAYRFLPGGRNGPVLSAVLAVAAFLVAMAISWASWKRVGAANLAMGGLAWWLLPTILSTLLLPGGSYLFLWPLAGGLIGSAAAMLGDRAGAVATYLGAIPALALLPTTIAALCDALGPSLPIASAPPAALLALALVPIAARAFKQNPAASPIISAT